MINIASIKVIVSLTIIDKSGAKLQTDQSISDLITLILTISIKILTLYSFMSVKLKRNTK